MARMNLPLLLAATPADRAGLAAAEAFLPALAGGTLLLVADGGLSVFHVAHLLALSLAPRGIRLGLALHTRDGNAIALRSDLVTARDAGFQAFALVEPDWRTRRSVNDLGSAELVRLARETLGPDAALIVPNRLSHPADARLLDAHRAAGADHLLLTAPGEPALPVPAGMILLRPRSVTQPGDLAAGNLLHRLAVPQGLAPAGGAA